jgi:hypothetical protein
MASEHDLRCFCGRSPLLAIYGVDEDGNLFVHVRVYKGKRLYHESVLYGGIVKLRCRECYRWHRVLIRPRTQKAELTVDQHPPSVSPVMPQPPMLEPTTIGS